jgi:cell division transport system permease protein
MRALEYFFREATLSLWRQGRSTLLSILTIALAMAVLAVFVIVSVNLERAVARWMASAEFSVYLRDDATDVQRAAIERALLDSGLVASREYVSKAQAGERFTRDFPALGGATVDQENPLPASYEVRMRPEAARSDAMERLAGRVARADGVADVRYDRAWLDRLATLARAARWVGVALALIVLVAAALTVVSVVRLGLYTRQQEIEIMQLVGAPLAYIRGPFVVEGLLQGGVGALAALVIVWPAFVALRARLDAMGGGVVEPGAFVFLPVAVAALLVAGGMIVGSLGGWVAGRAARPAQTAPVR